MDPLPTLEELRSRGPATAGRQLTEDEAVQARANKRESPRKWGKKGEDRAKYILEKLMGATVKRKEDTLRTYTGDDGEEHTFYRSGGVDFEGVIPLSFNGHVRLVPFEMEVKTFQGSFGLSNLSKDQRRHLNKVRRDGHLALVTLCERVGEDIVHVWFIPWRDRTDNIMGAISRVGDCWDWHEVLVFLEDVAVDDKRFRGRSIRQKDLDVLDSNRCYKEKGRWQLAPWMRKLKAAGQLELL